MDYWPTKTSWWLLMAIGSSSTACLAWVLKMVAYKYDRVSRIAPIFYLESVIGLLYDHFVFDVTFSSIQIIGITLVFSLFGVKIF